MSLTIDRLRIRIPAGTTREPEAFARAVADRIAGEVRGVSAPRSDTLKVKVTRPGSDVPGAIARHLGGALRGTGER